MRFDPLPSPLPGARLWSAKTGGYIFVIMHEDGTQLVPEDRAEWTGYTATYTNPKIKGPVRIDGLWQSFAAAEQACRDTWRQLRKQN